MKYVELSLQFGLNPIKTKATRQKTFTTTGGPRLCNANCCDPCYNVIKIDTFPKIVKKRAWILFMQIHITQASDF